MRHFVLAFGGYLGLTALSFKLGENDQTLSAGCLHTNQTRAMQGLAMIIWRNDGSRRRQMES
jgi:hypothetical protein